ncbi:MAG: DUF2231 domain-containing protein [Parachlamydiaceae bacterium]|nr:MAG: DUF2231 domain-containing protein [Parachlamydiaceae bacterium]
MDYHSLFCDLIFLFRRDSALAKTADWMVIAAAITIIPTALTGLILSGWEVDSQALLFHRNWAFATLAFTLIHALFRVRSLSKEAFSPGYLMLSAINLALIGVTSDFGGVVAFGKGVLV